MMRTLSALGFLLLAASPLAAQSPAPRPAGPELVDRVVAVVGDTALLLSDVQAELQQLEASGRPLPADPVQREAIARQVLDEKVNQLVLVEAARDAGIEVGTDDVKQLVEQDIREVVQRFGGSEVRFAQALEASGLTVAQYRQSLEQRYRDEYLRDQFLAAQLRNRARPLVSEEQLRAAFAESRAALGTRPATISLRQVMVKTEPSDSARAEALATAQDVLRQLQEGGDFEVLAKRFSDDPGSKEHGGDLGWFKPGRMVKEFEQMAFSLRPGQISPIVKTEFGYHIIKLEKVRGAERQARHILIKPETTPADLERARQRADSIATALRAGANPASLARAYGTPAEEAEVTRVPIDRLPPAYGEPLREAGSGEVVGPVELEMPTGTSFAVVKVTERLEPGPYTLEDVREQLTTRLQEREMIQQLVRDLRDRSVFVQIQM